MNYPALFKEFLLSQTNPSSQITIKNYSSDVNRFIKWFETKFQKQFSPDEINTGTINAFEKEALETYSASSVNRSLSSLRKFFTFLKLEGLAPHSPFDQLASDEKEEKDPWRIKDFKNHLYVFNASHLTIKNYIIDVKQFLTWAEAVIPHEQTWDTTEGDVFQKIDSNLVEEYKKRLINEAKLSPVSVNRKLSSLRRYISWAQEEGIVGRSVQVPGQTKLSGEINDLRLKIKETPSAEDQIENLKLKIKNSGSYSSFPPFRLAQKAKNGVIGLADGILIYPLLGLVEKLEHAVWVSRGRPVSSTNSKLRSLMAKLNSKYERPNAKKIANVPKSFYAPALVSTKYFPIHKKVWHHLRNTRPQWYRRYQNTSVYTYFRLAIMILFVGALAFALFSYINPNKKQSPSLAAGLPNAPNRVLSFQGRLTDNSDNPITSSTNITFKIYSVSSGGSALWTETDTIAPDSDGIFSLLLGNSTPIPQSLFANYSTLYLGVTVAATSELTPRQQIATVAFATNSEFLDGMLPINSPEATNSANVVLALNSSGNLVIGNSASPTFQATGGTFTVSGQVVALTTNVGSAGNIQLNPDGLGTIDLQKPLQNSTLNNNIAQAAGAVEVDDNLAVLATSSGTPAFLINQNSTGDLIDASTSGVTKFAVDYSGNTTLSGTTITANSLATFNTAATLALSGDLTISGNDITNTTLNLGGGSAATIGTVSNDALSLIPNGTGALNLGTTNTGNVSIGNTTGTDYLFGSGITANQNSVLYAGSSNALTSVNTTTNGLCLVSGASTPTWTSCAGASLNWWNELAGALSPVHTTDDFLLGSTATSSALFSFTGIQSATHQTIASLSGNLVVMPNNGFGGNVAIGRTSASYRLDVSTANSSDLVRIYQSDNSGQGILALSFDTTQRIRGNTTVGLGFFSGNAERLTILPTGNVGILNTSPRTSLDVTGSASISANLAFNGSGTTHTISTFDAGNINFDMVGGGSGTGRTALYLQNTGNVGIGTTGPDRKLDVLDASNPQLRLTQADGTQYTDFQTDASSNLTISAAAASKTLTLTNYNTLTASSLTTLTLGTNPTINAGATALNLQADGAIDVNIAGGSGAGTGCTVTNSTGDLTCTGNISGASSGTLGYWTRSSSFLYPANLGDSVGVGTSHPDLALEINSATGNNLRLTYNDSNGSAAHYTDFTVSSGGDLTIAPQGNDMNITGNASASGTLTVGDGTTNQIRSAYGPLTLAAKTGANSWTDLIYLQDAVSGGRVGIKNSAPLADLDVAGTASISGDLTIGNGSYIKPAFGPLQLGYKVNATTWNPALTVDTVGNVGIGETGPKALLSVGSGSLFQVNSSGNVNFNQTSPTVSIGNTGSLVFNDGSNTLCTIADGGSVGNLSCSGSLSAGTSLSVTTTASISGTLTVGNGTSNRIQSAYGPLTLAAKTGANSWTDLIYLQDAVSGGRVGIKNSAPLADLDVAGTASISGDLTIGNGSYIKPAYGPLTLAYKSAPNTWTDGITLQNGTGNVGIGETGPAALLSVGSGSLFQINTLGNVKFNQTSPTVSIGNTGSLVFNDGSNTLCTIADGGSVGNLSCTGSLSAGTSLNVATTASISGTLTVGNGTSNRIQSAYGPLTLAAKTGANSWTDLIYLQDAVPGGRVGIKNSAPLADLDVNGTASVSGDLTIGNGSSIKPAFGDLTLAYKVNATTWNPALTVDTVGNVGIGTTAPASQLAVGGAGNSLYEIYAAQSTSTGVGVWGSGPSDGTGVYGYSNGGTGVIGNGATGIGVYGYTTSSGVGGYFATDTGTGVHGVASSTGIGGYFNSSSGYAIIVPSGGGNVGIGTTGPDRKLDVLDASNPQLRLTYTDGSVYTDFQTDASGNLTINATGTKTILSDNLEVNGNNIQDSGAASAITFDGAENTQMNGDLTIAAGKDITMTNGAGTFTETSNATTASNVATITADSLTTKNVLTLSGAALTTGNALSITGPSSGTTKTTALIAATSNIGATGTSTGMVNFTATATPTGGGSSIGLYNKLVNSNSTLANSGYGIYNTLTDAIALGNTNYGNYTLVNNTGAVSGGTKTIYGNYIDARGTGATTSPDTEVYGQYITTNASNGDVSGTVNQYGLYIANGTSSTNGTSTKYLLYVDAASGADTRYAAYFAGGNVNIQSLTASSGVYTDVNDNLTSTIPTTGAVGYWSRTGSTLSPTNGPGSDNVYTTGLLSIGSATAPTAGVAYFNGAVGIGNTAPAARLQITTAAQGEPPALGAGATGSGFILASTNNLYGLYAGVRTNGDTWLQSTRNDATATAYNILLNPSGGNVGIGTTSPLEPLDVKVGTSTHIGFFSAGSNLASLSTWNDTFSGWQTLYLNSNTTGGGNVIMNGGNVGIGTTAPLAKLSIGSGSLTDANLPAQINAGAAGEAFYGINNNGGYGLIVGYENNSDAAPTAGAMIRNISATPIYFNVSNTTNAMTILANGNVGIGTTSPPLLLSAIGGTTGYPIAIGGGAQTNGIARMGTGAQSLDFGWGGATPWGFWIQAHLNTNTSAAPLLLNPNGGNVGIGTTAPAGKLQVQTTNYDLLTSTTTVDIGAGGAGTGWARAFRTVNTSGSNGQNGAAFGALGTGATPTYAYMSIPTSDATGYDSTKILVLNNSGNVGIGTTSPAAADGSARTFQIGDRSIFQSTVGTQTLLSNNAYYDGAWKYAVSSYASAIRLNGLGTTGDITFSTAASGTAGSTISNWDTTSVRMTILNGGNVGIGTTGPGAKLEVNATTGTAANFQVTSGTASPATGGLLGLGIQNNDATSNSLSGILFSSQDTGGSLRHMGGIVSGKSDTWTAADTTTWDSFLSFWTRLNGGLETEAMRINANGNVGIGTTNPIQQVQISGASQTTAALADAGVTGGTLMLTGTNSAGGSGGALEFSALNGNGTYVPQAAIKSLLINSTTNGVGDLAFSTRNAVADVALTERMRILSGGNVGIGTTGPGAKLDVVGGSIRTDTQLISTVATGTSPLAVTSTTKVTNLNADLLDGLNSDSAYNGFVGGTIPIRHPSGYLFSNYFNMSANDVGAVTDTHLAVETGSDGYLRWQTPSELVTAQGNHVVGDQDTTRSNLDFNTQLQTGFYNFDASPTNGPGAVYGQLIVADGIDTGLQIAGGYTNNLYYRGWSSSGGAFTSWYKIWSTQNLGDYNGRIRIADIGCSSSWASSCDANGNGQTDAADALTADPADCGTGLYANGINASGTATNCSQRLDSSGTPTFSTLTTTGAINGQTISPTANFTGTVAITTTLSAGVSTLTNVTLPNSNVAPTVGIYQGGGYVQIRGGTSGFAVNNTANTVSNLLITDAGAVTIPGAFAFSGGGNFSIASAGMDVTTAGAVSGVTTLDTGLGAHELYAMNQDVQTSDTVNFSDIHVIRTGSATTGVVYLGNAGTHYLYFDGTKYNLVSADLALGGAITGATTIAASSTITGTTLNGTTGINTGATAGTNRIDASGNLVNIGTITSGAINSQTISSAASFNGTVAVATSTTTPFYNVTAADGNGICFWQDCATYKIHMGNAAENHYGPVTGYSIKTNMSNAGWGWTWGATGATPVIAMEATGKMQIAGNFVSMGSVGIGTTSINASNKLDVIGGGILISSADGHADASLHISTAYGGNGRTTQISNATGALNIMSGDNASWYSWGVGSDNIWRINSGTSFSSGGLNINSSNNVGIGTTSPIQQTQISGSSQTTAALTDAGNTGGTLLLSGTASTAGSGGTLDFSALNGNGTYVPQAAIKSLLTNGSTNGVGDLAFSTRNAVGDTALTERMRILSGGNVGIGTTAPLTPLHVSGAALATFTGTSRGILSLVNPYGTGTSYQAIDFLYSANNLPVARIAPLVSPTGTFLTFGTSNSYGTGITNTAMVISPTGNVGIGTTAPASQLSVGGAGISGAGVYGIGSSFGVYATSSTGIGVYGTNGSAGGVGVYGENTSSGVGGYFSSATGLGVEIGKGGITLDSSGTIQFVTGGTSIDSTSGAMRANVSTKFAVLGGFIQEDVPAASGTFAICHTTNGAQANAALNDCVNPPTDIAEFYPGTSDLQPGDLVSLVPNNGSFSQYRVVKSTSPYDPNLIGAVSTTPTGPNGSPLGENTIPDSQSPQAIGLSGRVPMKVSLENGPIHVNDYLTSSSTPGVAMKATKASRVVGKALENYDGSVQVSLGSRDQERVRRESNITVNQDPVDPPPGIGKILVFTNLTWYDPDVQLANDGNLTIAPTVDDNFKVQNNGQDVSRIGAFAELVVAQIKAGLINAQVISTNSLAVVTDNITVAGQKLSDYIGSIVDQKLAQNSQSSIVNGQLSVNVISPLSTDENAGIKIKLNDNQGKSKLEIQNASGSAVASIDSQGNASISGQLSANGINTKDATISGTLHAGKIVADDIEGLNAKIATLSSQTITNNYYIATPSANSQSSIVNGQSATGSANQSASDSGQLVANPYALDASASASFNDLFAKTATFEQGLMSFGSTSLFEASVADRLFVGSQLSIADNSINVLGGNLKLQPLSQGGVSFEGDLITIDTNGNLKVNGNADFAKDVNIKGTLAANIIAPLPDQDLKVSLASDSGKLEVQNASQSGVLSINNKGDLTASGAGTFNKLNLSIVPQALAISDTEVVASSSAGTIILKANKPEITIDNPIVTANSLIYITPVGQTYGQSLYLSRQVPNVSFTVGIGTQVVHDIKFNYLIIN